LSREDQEYSRYLQEIGHRITFIPQEGQQGFGHAVYCAREWVGHEPFLLLLGDHLYAADSDDSCARQILDAYERAGTSLVGVKETRGEEVKRFGCVTGEWKEPGTLLEVTEFVEKPDLEYAVRHLHVPDMADNAFLTVFGQYVLSPRVFGLLEEHIRACGRERGQIELTPCLDRLRQEEGVTGFVVKGRRFDIGRPEAYLATLREYHARSGAAQAAED